MAQMPRWKLRLRWWMRESDAKRDRRYRGWRFWVFNRGSVCVVSGFVSWLYEEPWAAVWICAVIVAGAAVAVLIRATSPK